MQRSITYTLLITCVLLFTSCKTHYSKASYEAENIMVAESLNSLDNEVVQIYLPYKNILEKDMNRVISFSENEMIKDKPESNLTNFLADLLLVEGKRVAVEKGYAVEPDISFFNYGGIRTYLPEGEITVGNIFELMPFENEMVYLRLTGAQVAEFLNVVAQKGGDSVGGVRFVISDEKAKQVKIAGNPLENNKQYWLVTNDYVAAGGDDLEVFTRRLEYINSGEKIREVIIAYMEDLQKNGKNLTAKKDGRIRYE
jgi:2',3'-cyclic-nucleotide 2'-phosphodiesterase (5'-nucleotidase family)